MQKLFGLNGMSITFVKNAFANNRRLVIEQTEQSFPLCLALCIVPNLFHPPIFAPSSVWSKNS
jgi:hypothetical protein